MPNGPRVAVVRHRVVVPVVQVRSAPLRVVAQVTVAVRGEQVAVSAHRQAHRVVVRLRERLVHAHVRVAVAREGASLSAVSAPRFARWGGKKAYLAATVIVAAARMA